MAKKNSLKKKVLGRVISKINESKTPNESEKNANGKNSNIGDDKNIVVKVSHKNTGKGSKNKKQKNEKLEDEVVYLTESNKDHFFTFQLKIDLFTLIYTTLVFKWVQTDRVMIVVDQNKLGYHLELFLKHFRINSIFLDSEMPLGTNRHYASQFVKGVYTTCVTNTTYNQNTPNYSKEILNQTPIPVTIIYFDTLDSSLLEYHCFHPNVKAIYHFLSTDNKQKFTEIYNGLDSRIIFDNFKFDIDQMRHLSYRCEDIFHSIKKSDVKKCKIKKVNQELLQSKNMQDYFKSHPQEKITVIRSIQENSIKSFKPSAAYIPSYLVHNQEDNNIIANAIKTNYGNGKGRRRNNKGTMEKYMENLEKNDGSHELVKF